jgi:sugar lactone lactonase YvrE
MPLGLLLGGCGVGISDVDIGCTLALLGGEIQGCPLHLQPDVTILAGINGAAASDLFHFSNPGNMTTDGTSLYVVDQGAQEIRKVTISSGVESVLVPGRVALQGITYSGGVVYFTEGDNIHFADATSGAVTSFFSNGLGTLDGAIGVAQFNSAGGLVVLGQSLYVADTGNCKIRKIDLTLNFVTSLAGNSAFCSEADGTGSSAHFNNPAGIATDGTFLYVADLVGNTLRKIDPSTGVTTTLASGVTASFSFPRGLVTDGVYVYVASSLNHRVKRVRITTGEVTTLFGDGTATTTPGGAGAQVDAPVGMTSDGHSLFVSSGSNVILKVR